MAKIRFEDVSITAKVIELDEIADPTAFLKGMGLQNAKVLEDSEDPPLPDTKEEMDDNLEAAYMQGASDERGDFLSDVGGHNAKVEILDEPKESEQAELSLVPEDNSFMVEDFKSARRLRDIIDIFMGGGLDEEALIIERCKSLKNEGQPLLKRVTDIDERIPLAIKKWHLQDAKNRSQ